MIEGMSEAVLRREELNKYPRLKVMNATICPRWCTDVKC